jgi:hypothetical protein
VGLATPKKFLHVEELSSLIAVQANLRWKRATRIFLHPFDTANTSRQIGAEQTAVGGLVCESAHGTET